MGAVPGKATTSAYWERVICPGETVQKLGVHHALEPRQCFCNEVQGALHLLGAMPMAVTPVPVSPTPARSASRWCARPTTRSVWPSSPVAG